jgi:membrane peptidoglycan carboxypeptidase
VRVRRGHVVRPVVQLLGLCLVAGIVAAGIGFPAALALGMLSSEASDSVNSVPTDMATGFFCKYVTDYLAQAGLSAEQIQRGGYTIRSTLDSGVMEKMKASLNAELPADTPNVANVMAIVEPGQDHPKVLAVGSSRTFGLDRPPGRPT